MLKAISDGISIKLNSVYGAGYEIHTENVEQGLIEPCFFIKPLLAVNKAFLGKRKQRTYPFVITYFPKEGNEEMYEVSDTLLEELEYITLVTGETVRAASLEAEIVDKVLHVTATYKVFLNDISRAESMGSMKYSNKGVKGAK